MRRAGMAEDIGESLLNDPAAIGNVTLACPLALTLAVPTAMPQSVNVTVPQAGAPLAPDNVTDRVKGVPAAG